MIDALLVALLLFLGVRGWYRGLVREALDLAGLVVGIVLGFRFGPLLGGVIASMAGVSVDTGRLVGGLILLVATGVGAAFLARAIERVRRPGINLIDRAGRGPSWPPAGPPPSWRCCSRCCSSCRCRRPWGGSSTVRPSPGPSPIPGACRRRRSGR